MDFVVSSWSSPVPGPSYPGDDVDLPFEVARLGSAKADQITTLTVTVFRWDGSTKQIQTDRDGVLQDKVSVTTTIATDLYLYRYKIPDDSPIGIFFALWEGNWRGNPLPNILDRFRVAGIDTVNADFEFGKPQPVA